MRHPSAKSMPIRKLIPGRVLNGRSEPIWRSSAHFLIVWTGLNVLVQISWPLRNIRPISLLAPSQELFAVLWILCISAWMSSRFSRHLNIPFTAFMIFAVIFRTADHLVPIYFDRPFNLFIDSRFVPDLVSLLYDTMTPVVFFGWTAAVVLVGIIAWSFFHHGFAWIERYFEQDRHRKFFMGAANLLLVFSLGWILIIPRSGPGIFSPGIWPRITAEIGFILHIEKTRRQQLALLETAMKRLARLPSSLDRLGGRNVYVLFVESYGQTAFEDPRHFAVIAPVIARLENDPRFSACSAFLRSPTMSGSSWLAHGTLAGGVMTDSHLKFNLLLASQVKPLAYYFNQAGYRSIGVMPGTRSARPEDTWFEFQQTYDAGSLGYHGPAFGWATMPDQFVLDSICRKEIAAAAAPLFIEFILVSSHAAFNLQPPFIDDWAMIGDGSIYHDTAARTFPVVWPDLTDAHDAYAAAIAYELTVLEGFLQRCADPGALIIVLGDHQPSPQISGEEPSRSVPVHIISKDPEVLSPFMNRGYTPGFIPRQPLPHPGMDSFLEGFLKDFSSR